MISDSEMVTLRFRSHSLSLQIIYVCNFTFTISFDLISLPHSRSRWTEFLCLFGCCLYGCTPDRPTARTRSGTTASVCRWAETFVFAIPTTK